MKIISLNVGLPREVSYHGRLVETGIFKSPISRPVMARTLNFDGDQQADLSVHGGVDKAIYDYPSEHYEYWRKELPDVDFPWGVFGENLTTEGLFEDSMYIGDRYRIGEIEVVVTQPRLPCYKLGLRFDRADMVKRFLASRRSGFYFAVKKEGFVQTGDSIELLSRDPCRVSVTDIVRVYAFEREDVEMIRRAMSAEALPESWREYFQKQLEKPSG
ncbi:MAG TPA: MOSC domain-containing protein [Blastocatellia bacterium]|nr:MOSC domain-containing protein [Blastocatellia bacterium]